MSDLDKPGPLGYTLTMGDGTTLVVPSIKKDDQEGRRSVAVWLPNLSGLPLDHEKDPTAPAGLRMCRWCHGRWLSGNVEGGFRLHIQLVEDRWCSSVRPCPRCVFGAYRKIALPTTPWAEQFPECSDLEIGFLWAYFRNANMNAGQEQARTPNMLAALDSMQEPKRRPKYGLGEDYYAELHARLERGIKAIEFNERHASGRERQAADAF